MTKKQFATVKLGDTLTFTKKYREDYAKDAFELCNRQGILDLDSSKDFFVRRVLGLPEVKVSVKVLSFSSDVGCGEPGIRGHVTFSDKSEFTAWFTYKGLAA